MNKKNLKESRERRTHPRKTVNIPVGIGSHTGEHRVETVNVSKSGFCCMLRESIPLFTKVVVTLDIPQEGKSPKRIVCEGVVVRQEEVEINNETFFETAVFLQGLADIEALALAEHVGENDEP